jgi:hypothetical protein
MFRRETGTAIDVYRISRFISPCSFRQNFLRCQVFQLFECVLSKNIITTGLSGDRAALPEFLGWVDRQILDQVLLEILFDTDLRTFFQKFHSILSYLGCRADSAVSATVFCELPTTLVFADDFTEGATLRMVSMRLTDIAIRQLSDSTAPGAPPPSPPPQPPAGAADGLTSLSDLEDSGTLLGKPGAGP